jgi:ankyrin repeat protein
MVFAAAEVGNVDALNMLVAAGADVNAPATTGETPTHVAWAKGHAAAAAFLLGRGGVATAPARKKSKFGFPSPKKSPSEQ